jgi:quercetin dioxygenase-like cupin family protein
LIVAAIGTVTYNFDNDLSYTLNPGDSVLITKGVYHQPVITEPRVTLSFSWN